MSACSYISNILSVKFLSAKFISDGAFCTYHHRVMQNLLAVGRTVERHEGKETVRLNSKLGWVVVA